MGKNTKGGKKQKSQRNNDAPVVIKIDKIQPNNVDTFAGLVTKALGSKRFIVLILENNIEIQVKLAGSVRARVALQDYVLVQKAEELSGCNAYILHKYSAEETVALGIKKVTTNIDGTVDIDGENEIEFDIADI